MRFEFYTPSIENVPKLSVDGTVPHSIHFSHWEGNTTPAAVKADTSTEIALNLVASPNKAALTKGIELVTNNHFDTDGVLSVWTVLTGERALEYRDRLVSAAEAGDFSEHSSDEGVRISIAIQGPDQASSNNDTPSPLAGFLAGQETDDEAKAYELVLPEVERLLADVNRYEPLWRDGWKNLAAAFESFARGESRVTEYADSNISLITLAPELFTPNTAISKFARGELFVIGIPTAGGWFYRFDYPYYSWAETVVRPLIARRDFASTLQALNEEETYRDGEWRMDDREMTSAVKFLDNRGHLAASRLEPDRVIEILQQSTKTKVQKTNV